MPALTPNGHLRKFGRHSYAYILYVYGPQFETLSMQNIERSQSCIRLAKHNKRRADWLTFILGVVVKRAELDLDRTNVEGEDLFRNT